MDKRVKTAITKKAQLVHIPRLGINIPKPRFALHPSQRFKRLGTGVLAAVGFVAIARTADIIIAWLQQRQLQAKSSEYYAKMLEAHPALRKEKPEVVARY